MYFVLDLSVISKCRALFSAILIAFLSSAVMPICAVSDVHEQKLIELTHNTLSACMYLLYIFIVFFLHVL